MTSHNLGNKILLNEPHSSNVAWRLPIFYRILDQLELNCRKEEDKALFAVNTNYPVATCAIDCCRHSVQQQHKKKNEISPNSMLITNLSYTTANCWVQVVNAVKLDGPCSSCKLRGCTCWSSAFTISMSMINPLAGVIEPWSEEVLVFGQQTGNISIVTLFTSGHARVLWVTGGVIINFIWSSENQATTNQTGFEGWGDKQFTYFFNYMTFVIRSKLHIKASARSCCQRKQSILPFQTSVQQGQGNLCPIFLRVA